MLFLSSVNFDYGAMPVMTLESILSFRHSLIARCGYCRGVDWELQSTLFTNACLVWLQDTQTLPNIQTDEHLCTHTAYHFLSYMHLNLKSQSAFLKSKYLCLGLEYSYSALCSSHLWWLEYLPSSNWYFDMGHSPSLWDVSRVGYEWFLFNNLVIFEFFQVLFTQD